MPSSLLALAPAVVALVAERALELDRPINVLDVGVGHGKYGLLLREYLGDRLGTLVGVESEPRYLDRFAWLEELYDGLIAADATTLTAAELEPYDVVLLADSVEHLDDDAATDFLRRIPGAVVLSTPRDYFQNPEAAEYPSESHRSHWSAAKLNAVRPLDRVDFDSLELYAAVLVRMAPL